MTRRQERIEFTQRDFERDGLRRLIEEAAIGRTYVRVGDRPVKVSLRLAVDEGLDAGSICGGADKELISPVRNAEGVFVRRT